YQLMAKKYFMALSLVFMGICCRLSVFSKIWTNELTDCYLTWIKWIQYFPKDTIPNGSTLIDYESELPESLESLFSRNTSKFNIPTNIIKEQAKTQLNIIIEENKDGLLDL